MINHQILIFFISLLTNAVIVILAKKIDVFITDHLHFGPQKFHENPTPRIGGLGIFLAMSGWFIVNNYWIFLLVSIPVFLAGFIEDITKTLHPKVRLFLMSVSGVLAYFLLDAKILKVNLPIVDNILAIPLFSFLFTIFSLVGIANAVNIIDGFNGLASGVSIMILSSIAFVANSVGDTFIRDVSVVFIFAIFGFFVLNWPFGKIFLGDGGAYFIGFLVGLLAVILVERNSIVSPWFALTVMIYPVWEVVFSFYRKKFLRGLSPFEPDGVHFHMIIYKILVKGIFPDKSKLLRNSISSVFIWTLNFTPVILSTVFYNNTLILMVVCVSFVLVYNTVYKKLIYSKIGNFMN